MLNTLLNIELMKNPLNWIGVGLIVLLGAFAAHAIIPTVSPGSTDPS